MSSTSHRHPAEWSAAAFLVTDQHEFGHAWRYELVNGRIVAHAAPAPKHGAILAALTTALGTRLLGKRSGCRPESGSGAVPEYKRRDTARIPDAMIRCHGKPVVMFEVISPAELGHWRDRDTERRDLQAVPGAQEIVEIYQAEQACHIYRRQPDETWTFEAVDGDDAILSLRSVDMAIPLAEIYAFADDAEADEPAA